MQVCVYQNVTVILTMNRIIMVSWSNYMDVQAQPHMICIDNRNRTSYNTPNNHNI